MTQANQTEDRVQFISADATWTIFWRFISRNRRIGAVAMVKWRSLSLGVEWFRFKWIGLFLGPFCFAVGLIEKPEQSQ